MSGGRATKKPLPPDSHLCRCLTHPRPASSIESARDSTSTSLWGSVSGRRAASYLAVRVLATAGKIDGFGRQRLLARIWTIAHGSTANR